MTRSATLGLLAVAFACIAEPSSATVRRVLLSVHGLQLPKKKAVYAFNIDTYGVEYLAVCHLPMGWELRSERSDDFGGYMSGEADLHASPLTFTSMYLVDVYDYRSTTVRSGNTEHPASFQGWVKIGSREQFGDWHGRKVPLRPNNFRLTDARRCPDPPPPAP